MRASTGDSYNGEAMDTQRVGQLHHVVGPIEECAVPLEVGQAIARAIDSDRTGTEGHGNRLVGMLKQPSTGGAREEENGSARQIAAFGKAQRPAVRQQDRLM